MGANSFLANMILELEEEQPKWDKLVSTSGLNDAQLDALILKLSSIKATPLGLVAALTAEARARVACLTAEARARQESRHSRIGMINQKEEQAEQEDYSDDENDSDEEFDEDGVVVGHGYSATPSVISEMTTPTVSTSTPTVADSLLSTAAVQLPAPLQERSSIKRKNSKNKRRNSKTLAEKKQEPLRRNSGSDHSKEKKKRRSSMDRKSASVRHFEHLHSRKASSLRMSRTQSERDLEAQFAKDNSLFEFDDQESWGNGFAVIRNNNQQWRHSRFCL